MVNSILGIFSVIVLVSLVSCSRKEQPAQSIPEDKFVKFYADMLILSNDTSAVSRDSAALKERTDSLYLSYGVDSSKVRQMIDFYGGDSNRWRRFFNQVVSRLAQIQQEQHVEKEK